MDMASFDGAVTSHMRVMLAEKMEAFFIAATAAHPSKKGIKELLDPMKRLLKKISPEEPVKPVDQKAIMSQLASKMKGFKRG